MCRKSTQGIVLLALGLVLAPAATQGQVVNLVKNPSFEQDEVILNDAAYAQWWTWGYDVGVNSTAKFDPSTSIDGTRSLRVDPQGSTNWYFIVAYSPLAQKVGTKYTASFWAKGLSPRPLTVDMKATDNSVTWGSTDFQLTADWAEYHFTAAAQNGTVKLQFSCAGSQVPLWLDFVYVYEGDYVAGIKPSGLVARTNADQPTPADKAVDVPRDTALGWTASAFAATHDVYLGQTRADVNSADRTRPAGVLVSQGQTGTGYTPATVLDFGRTYYWRVDEVNQAPDNTIYPGTIWSFTVEPYAYPITRITATASTSQPGSGPENTINGSGLTGDLHGTDTTTMWMSTNTGPHWIQYQFDKIYSLYDLKVWNSNGPLESFMGFGAKDVKIEYSPDGTSWTALPNVPQFARAPGMRGYAANTTVSFGGVLAQYVKLTIGSTWGGMSPMTGLSEVRFSYVPLQARAPQPADGATAQDVTTTLNWRPGRDVTTQQVYFGTDAKAVAQGTVAARTVGTHAFDPGPLAYGTTYYWKVDEVGAGGTYPGPVWSFSTQEFAVVDDFESYDQDNHRLYDTWIDGASDGKSGSYVGYNPTAAQLAAGATFAETTIIHGGKQALPMAYDNSKTPFYSEAARTFDTPQDWTTHGADTLSLWFRGRAVAFLDNGDGTYTMSSSGTDIWNNGDQFRFAYKSLSGDGSMVARVDSVANTNAWAKAGVMIRQSIDPASTHAFMPITPGGSGAGNGASFQRRLTASGSSTNDDKPAPAIAPPYWVKIERKGNSFSGSIAPDGKTWTQLGTAQTINMTNPVLIGLAVCSHDAARTTVAEFSNLSMTGTVTGSWQIAAIGMAMPTNEAAPLYVTVQDQAGKSKTVVNANAAATNAASWTQWQIPLSSLTGVSLTSVKQLILGVGDKTNPKAGGAGLMFIDDIGLGHPAVK